MRFVLLLTLAFGLSATEEKLTQLDQVNIELADLKIRLAEADYQKALLLKQTVIANICERVDASISKCSIDRQSGVIKKQVAEAPKETKK